MPSTDTKPELTAKASMAQPVSQPAVYANGLKRRVKQKKKKHCLKSRDESTFLMAYRGVVGALACFVSIFDYLQ
jgi:hypothetical protein